jgi:hypothetical protein
MKENKKKVFKWYNKNNWFTNIRKIKIY